jgi:putative spermidine/putrescine transport system permease protein
MFRRLDSRSDPMIAAVSVIMIMLTLSVVMIVQRTVGLTRGFVR